MARQFAPRDSIRRFFFGNQTASRKSPPVLTGLACGLAAISVCQGWIASFGTGSAATLTAIWAAVLGVVVGGRLCPKLVKLAPAWVWTLCLIGAVAMFPAALSLAAIPLSLVSIEALSTRWMQLICLIPGAVLVWSAGAFQVRLAVNLMHAGSTTGLLAGALLGGLLGMEWIAPLWGPAACLWSATIALAMLAMVQANSSQSSPETKSPATSGVLPTEPPPPAGNDRAAIAIFCGVLPAVLALMNQWFVPSVGLIYWPIAAFGAGCLAANWNWPRRFARIPSGTAFVAAMLLAGSMIAFESFWIALTFHSNLTWSSLWTIELARASLVGVIPFCFGIACGRELAQFVRAERPESQSLLMILAAAAWSVSSTALAIGVGPKIVITCGLMGAAIAFALPKVTPASAGRSWSRGRLASAAVLTALAVIGGISNHGLAERVAYRPLAVQFALQGAEWNQLIALDDSRPQHAVHTEAGRWTLWNHYGLQTVIRCNGMPVGAISHDYRVMPHSPVDVSLTAIPFAMHASPTRVCFLGWGSGVPVSTVLDFPVERVVCVEADAVLPGLTWPAGEVPLERGINPLDDERFQLYSVAPRDAVRTRFENFDLMISNSGISSLSGGSSEFTADFYRDAARHLSPEGIFCQRFQHADLGAPSVDDVFATLRAVFPTVVVVNVLPGESLLIATLAPEFESGEQLSERFQAAHQTRVLARCGWDWGHIQKLPILTADSVEAMVEQHPGFISRVANDRVAFAHARDLSRWGAKWQEKQSRLSTHQVRLADLAGAAGQTEEIRRRIDETNSLQFVMGSVPDRPWAYRATLRKGLQTKPRSTLVQVKGERPRQEMHPVDRRRVDYLKTLSAAYRSNPPEIEDVHRITEFFYPYDPLISYFTHHEAAELYSRIPDLDRRAEYLHRLHTIYFGDAQDRSIRNVIAAIGLLTGDEAVEADPQTRFDQLNGLLQILYQRWQTRRGQAPDSVSVTLNDITSSVNASEESLRTLERLAAETGNDPELWQARRQFLEAHLIRPLRSYRGQILPHQDKRPESTDAPADLDDDSEMHDAEEHDAEEHESGVRPAAFVEP